MLFRSEEARLREQAQVLAAGMQFQHDDIAGVEGGQEEAPAADSVPMAQVRHEPKIGRNEPCVCGSGKKYKHCCGRIS